MHFCNDLDFYAYNTFGGFIGSKQKGENDSCIHIFQSNADDMGAWFRRNNRYKLFKSPKVFTVSEIQSTVMKNMYNWSSGNMD